MLSHGGNGNFVQGLIGCLPMKSSLVHEKRTGVLRCDLDKVTPDVRHQNISTHRRYNRDPDLEQSLISIEDSIHENDADSRPRFAPVLRRYDNHGDTNIKDCINYPETPTQQSPLIVFEDSKSDSDNCHKDVSHLRRYRPYQDIRDVQSSAINPTLEEANPEHRKKHNGSVAVQSQFQRVDHINPCGDMTQHNSIRLTIESDEIISSKPKVYCQADIRLGNHGKEHVDKLDYTIRSSDEIDYPERNTTSYGRREYLGLVLEDDSSYSKLPIEGKVEEETNEPTHIQSSDEPRTLVRSTVSAEEQQFQLKLEHAEKVGNTFLRVAIPTENRQVESRPYPKERGYATSHNLVSMESTNPKHHAQLNTETSFEDQNVVYSHDSSVSSKMEKHAPTRINSKVQRNLEIEEAFRRSHKKNQLSILCRGDESESQHGMAHTCGPHAENILTQNRLYANQASSSHDDQLLLPYIRQSTIDTDHVPPTRLSNNECNTSNCNSPKRVSCEVLQLQRGYQTQHKIHRNQIPDEQSTASRAVNSDRPIMSPRLTVEQTVSFSSSDQFQDEMEGSQFTLQDPPTKFKRQLSNDIADQGSSTPILFTNQSEIDQVIPCANLGTPKRLKQSSFDTRSTSSHTESLNPQIRTSSVIRTPQAKEQNVFVFPETTPTSKQMDYRFHVSDRQAAADIHKVSREEVYPEVHINSHSREELYDSPVRKINSTYYLRRDRLNLNEPMHRDMYYKTVDSRGKPPHRSQSNIEDHSPSKLTRQELEKIRYLRSISLPVNKNSRGFKFRMQDTYCEEDARPEGQDLQSTSRTFRQGSHPRTRCNLDFNTYPMPNIQETGDRLVLNHTPPDSRRYDYHLPEEYGFHNIPRDCHDWPTYYNHFPPSRFHSHTSLCCNAFSANSNESNIRKSGDMNLRIQCYGIAGECQGIAKRLRALNNPSLGVNCDCKRIEEQVLQLAMDAYSKIPRMCYSQEEQSQMEHELNNTNSMVLEAIKVATRMKELCDHGRTITNVYNGSVIIRLNCPTLGSLHDLWMKYKSGELLCLINYIFATPRILETFSAKFIFFKVTLLEDEYKMCQKELLACLLKPPSTPSKKPTSPKKRRVVKSVENLLSIPISPKPLITKTKSSSSPILLYHSPLNSPRSPSKRERHLSFSSVGDQSPRKVFQDLTEQNSPRSPGRVLNLEEIRQVIESTDESDDGQENVFKPVRQSSPNILTYSPFFRTTSILSPLSPKNYSPR